MASAEGCLGVEEGCWTSSFGHKYYFIRWLLLRAMLPCCHPQLEVARCSEGRAAFPLTLTMDNHGLIGPFCSIFPL